jgi:DNA-binding LacI/PurR family transcriptional regulator
MTDVARLAGVHKTTVSLALRNHPSIPLSNRARIREIADRVGYLPDPVLGAFNFHRLSNHPIRSAPSMAFLSDLPSSTDFEASPNHREMYRGAKTQAEAMGYILERFFVGPRQLSPARLNRVLESRNISYVILGAFSTNTTELPLDWDRLCGLKIESFHVQPKIDVITADHRQAARLAVQNLRQLGYRRIGLILSHDLDLRLANLNHAGYRVEHQDASEKEVPILFIDEYPKNVFNHSLREWIASQHLDAIIAADNEIALRICAHAPTFSPGIALATLDVQESAANLAGILAGHRLVGARAVELLAISMHTNQRGIPAHTSTTYVPVDWQSGTSAPSRNPRARKTPSLISKRTV